MLGGARLTNGSWPAKSSSGTGGASGCWPRVAVLLWLVAAACVFFVVYVAIFHLYPKQQKLMRDHAIGNLPAQQVIEIQSLHFRVVEIYTLVIAAAFVAATLAAVCTVLLVLVLRQATMRQINMSLVQLFKELQQRK